MRIANKYYCSKCKHKVYAEDIKCKKCNSLLSVEGAVKVKQIHLTDESTNKQHLKSLKGVEGWLAFFSFTLVISLIITLATGVSDFVHLFAIYKKTPYTNLLLNIVMVGLVTILDTFIFGYLFYSLVSKKRNAVRLTKIFLSFVLFFSFIEILFGYFFIPIMLSRTIAFRTTMYSLIWLCYFLCSDKVEATYPPKTRTLFRRDKYILALLFCTIVGYCVLILLTVPQYLNLDKIEGKMTLQFIDNTGLSRGIVLPVEGNIFHDGEQGRTSDGIVIMNKSKSGQYEFNPRNFRVYGHSVYFDLSANDIYTGTMLIVVDSDSSLRVWIKKEIVRIRKEYLKT